METIKQARYCMGAVLVVYVTSSLIGWVHADSLVALQQAASGLAEKFADKHGPAFVFTLFLHNLTATYITMCLVTLWGLVPILSATVNGLLLGWIVVTALDASLVDAAVMLVPHGLFEWPAMVIAWGVGLWRGVGHRFTIAPGSYGQRWKRSNRVFVLVVAPLLLVAAVIEGRSFLF
jgi:uncharacterized membrane protein SpoIIM required for sporulation